MFMPFYALLQSVELDFGVYENRFTQYFSHIWLCCTSLPSLSVMLCLVPVSMKPLLLKSSMCSHWLAGPVCC